MLIRRLPDKFVGMYKITHLDMMDKIHIQSVVRKWGLPMLMPYGRELDKGQLEHINSLSLLVSTVNHCAELMAKHQNQLLKGSRRRKNGP